MKPRKRPAPEHAGRLARPPLEQLRSIKDDLVPETAAHIHAFDKAHAVMLVERGIIPRRHGALMLKALLDMEASGVVETRRAAGGGIHSGERYLRMRLDAAVAGQIGLARSSGDLSAVAMRLYARHAAEDLARLVSALRAALLTLADGHLETVMPGSTHGQHAQPTTLAHWALMFEAAMARDHERLLAFRSRANRSPAGAGIMTGSDFPIDRMRVARLLGFDGLLVNTMDAVVSHDLEIDFSTTVLQFAHTAGRLADDLMLWSTFEYSAIALPDWFCGTSSMMPQKKNPDGLEEIKSLAAVAAGLVVTIAATERGPTGFPIIERRRSDRVLRQLVSDLGSCLGAVPAVLAEMTVARDRMRDLAGANWAQATDLAALIVRHGGLDWRTAHELTGLFVRHCVDQMISPAQATPALFDQVSAGAGRAALGLPQAAFAQALDPAAFVRRRDLPGGPAPAAARKAAARARAQLLRDDRTLARLTAHNASAEAQLARAVAAVIRDS